MKQILLLGVVAVAVVSGACADSGNISPDQRASRPGATGSAQPAGKIQPVLVNSVLGLGANRVAVAFLDDGGRIVDDLEVRATLASADPAASTPAEVTLSRLRIGEHSSHGGNTGDPLLTVYGATVQFPVAGKWSILLQPARSGIDLPRARAELTVVEELPWPTVGEAIPPTTQSVLRDVAELRAIDTSPTPDEPLHRLTIAEALELRRPLVIGFATPGFCESRMCGPVVEEVLRPLRERYGESIEVIHIEPFDLVRARAGELVPVPAMAEWGLSTEPWVFVVGPDGRVAALFEGPLTFGEVEDVIKALPARG